MLNDMTPDPAGPALERTCGSSWKNAWTGSERRNWPTAGLFFGRLKLGGSGADFPMDCNIL